MTSSPATPSPASLSAVVGLNVAYLNVASALCRTEPQRARVLLHLDEEGVARLAAMSPSDVRRVADIPLALVCPHHRLTQAAEAQSSMAVLASIQASLAPNVEVVHDA